MRFGLHFPPLSWSLGRRCDRKAGSTGPQAKQLPKKLAHLKDSSHTQVRRLVAGPVCGSIEFPAESTCMFHSERLGTVCTRAWWASSSIWCVSVAVNENQHSSVFGLARGDQSNGSHLSDCFDTMDAQKRLNNTTVTWDPWHRVGAVRRLDSSRSRDHEETGEDNADHGIRPLGSERHGDRPLQTMTTMHSDPVVKHPHRHTAQAIGGRHHDECWDWPRRSSCRRTTTLAATIQPSRRQAPPQLPLDLGWPNI
jgi:hypothetical protein